MGTLAADLRPAAVKDLRPAAVKPMSVPAPSPKGGQEVHRRATGLPAAGARASAPSAFRFVSRAAEPLRPRSRSGYLMLSPLAQAIEREHTIRGRAPPVGLRALWHACGGKARAINTPIPPAATAPMAAANPAHSELPPETMTAQPANAAPTKITMAKVSARTSMKSSPVKNGCRGAAGTSGSSSTGT